MNGEEATGMQRVIEALECNSWANMVKNPKPLEIVQPQIQKKPEKEEQNEEIGEEQVEEFESLMEEMIRVKQL